MDKLAQETEKLDRKSFVVHTNMFTFSSYVFHSFRGQCDKVLICKGAIQLPLALSCFCLPTAFIPGKFLALLFVCNAV